MHLINMYLTLLYLFLYISVEFLFIHDPTERLLYLLARLHYLSLYQPVVDAAILLYLLQNRILLVYSVQITVLHIAESALPILIHALRRLDLALLNIHYLSNVEDVLNSSLDIADKFLGNLDLLVDGLG